MEGVTRRCVVGIAWIWQCWYCSLFCTSGILASSDKIWINAQRNINFIELWKRKENDEKKGFCTKERSLTLRTWNILNSNLSFWHICCSESSLNACFFFFLFNETNKQTSITRLSKEEVNFPLVGSPFHRSRSAFFLCQTWYMYYKRIFGFSAHWLLKYMKLLVHQGKRTN